MCVWIPPADQGSEGSGGEPTTAEPQVHICTWHPEEEHTSAPAPTADTDATVTTPTLDPKGFKGDEREETAMGPALPAAKVPAASQGGTSFDVKYLAGTVL